MTICYGHETLYPFHFASEDQSVHIKSMVKIVFPCCVTGWKCSTIVMIKSELLLVWGVLITEGYVV